MLPVSLPSGTPRSHSKSQYADLRHQLFSPVFEARGDQEKIKNLLELLLDFSTTKKRWKSGNLVKEFACRRFLGRRDLEREPRPETHLFERGVPEMDRNGFRSGAAVKPLGVNQLFHLGGAPAGKKNLLRYPGRAGNGPKRFQFRCGSEAIRS